MGPHAVVRLADRQNEALGRSAVGVARAAAVGAHAVVDDAAADEIKRIEDLTGLPSGDVWRGGAPKLWAAVADALGQMDDAR